MERNQLYVFMVLSDVEDRQDAVKRIQEDEKTSFLVANPTTGGFGLTLTACQYCYLFF